MSASGTKMFSKDETKGKGRDLITRDVWLDEAQRTLIDCGIDSVKILNLANNLGVTRGSFYWRFKCREDLLEELINTWKVTNTPALARAVASRPSTLAEWYVKIMLVWLDQTKFNVKLDLAIRDWARNDEAIMSAVKSEDNLRITQIQRAFEDIGKLEPRLAFTRARVLYYTQMGYYIIGNLEPPELRFGYLMEYCSVLTGDTLDEQIAQKYLEKFRPFMSSSSSGHAD